MLHLLSRRLSLRLSSAAALTKILGLIKPTGVGKYGCWPWGQCKSISSGSVAFSGNGLRLCSALLQEEKKEPERQSFALGLNSGRRRSIGNPALSLHHALSQNISMKPPVPILFCSGLLVLRSMAITITYATATSVAARSNVPAAAAAHQVRLSGG